MTERLSSPENERQPKPLTGLFQLSARNIPLERSPEGKIMPVCNVPRFAIKDVPVVRTDEGWSDFAKLLIDLLEGVDRELYQGSYGVAESPIEELTENMASGEIRLVSPEEYARAHTNKYGDAIYIPTFW